MSAASRPVSLYSIATAVPPYIIDQEDAGAVAHRLFAHRFADYHRVRDVFVSTGIATRRAARPIDWYVEPRGWAERNSVFLESGTELFAEAAQKALERAKLQAGEVDAVITVCSTGIATPSLEALTHQELGFRGDILRVPLFGLGCAGGIAGLEVALGLARSRPDFCVLLVALELCTLSFRLDKLSKANIVATSLFGDGAAAAIISSGEPKQIELAGAAQHMWPDTLQIMGWDVEDNGLGVVFDRAIPPFAQREVAPALDQLLRRMELVRGDVDRLAFHPGGAKVLAALETALDLGSGALAQERAVLREFGNMSSPTVLFVLEQILDQGPPGCLVASALGPGFTLASACLRSAQ